MSDKKKTPKKNPWAKEGNDKKSSSPWTNGGEALQKPTPDIDHLMRQGQAKMRNVLPGAFGGKRGRKGVKGFDKKIAGLGLLILVALWLASGFYKVEENEQGLELTFGKWDGQINAAGLKYHFPAPIGAVLTPVVTRINRIEVGFRSTKSRYNQTSTEQNVPDESLMLTSDENIIDINFIVNWKIKDAGKYSFKIRDPEGTVKMAAESVMREVVGQTKIHPALTQERSNIEYKTQERLQNLMDEYQSGISIEEVKLLQATPPAAVLDAFFEVQRAKADQKRQRNEAEAYRNDILPRARGEAKQMIQDALSYKATTVNHATGEAERFLSVHQSYKHAKEITAKRLYLETMEEILEKSDKIILPADQNILPYLPLNNLSSKRLSGGGK